MPPAGSPAPRIQVIEYGGDHWAAREIRDVEELAVYRDPVHLTWIDVQGLGDVAPLRRIAELFSIHPLALEDAVNAPSRQKAEPYDANHLIVTRMARFDEADELSVEQVVIFVGPRWLITVQERWGDVFDPVRLRTKSAPLMRTHGIDYLAYALLDTAIDGFFPVLETLGDEIEELEEAMIEQPRPELVRRLHTVRRALLELRRAIWPQRETVSELIREPSPFFTDAVRTFLRDTHDHAVQIVDVLESYRELAASLMELYLSALSQRTNQIMQMLTVIASVFIPLTFVVGIYGMNFDWMPELRWRYGYPAVLVAMLAVAGLMLWYFRRRGWLSTNGGGGG
jgi:magnesium transporter